MTLIRTGGGAFHPHDEPIYFLAVGSRFEDAFAQHRHLLIAVDQLNDRACRAVEAAARTGAKVFLDSGIFALTNEHARQHHVTMDEALALAPEVIDGFEELHHAYCTAVDRLGDILWGYTELDQGGRVNKVRTRATLEARGYRPIPVYHPINDGWDYLDELLTRYDRICCGNLVQAPTPTRLRLIATLSQRLAAYPGRWVHLLGVTPYPVLLAYPQASADSSSWNGALRGWQGWLRDTSTLAVLGSLADGAVGRPAILAANASPKTKATLPQLCAYLAHHVEGNWRTAVRDMA